jgi:hypothetical protein
MRHIALNGRTFASFIRKFGIEIFEHEKSFI